MTELSEWNWRAGHHWVTPRGGGQPVPAPLCSTWRRATSDPPPSSLHRRTRHPGLLSDDMTCSAPAKRDHEWAGKVGPLTRVFTPR